MAQIAANLQRIKNGQRRYAITPRVPAYYLMSCMVYHIVQDLNKVSFYS